MKIIFPAILFFMSLTLQSQYFLDPSFEDGSGWSSCDFQTTLDFQPSSFGVTEIPTDGNRCLGMVARGKLQQESKTEETTTKLILPLEADECYKLSFDLSLSLTINDIFGFYRDSISLIFYGGTALCEREDTLLQTPYFQNFEWQTFEYIIKPRRTVQYLTFETNVTDSSKGYLLMDKIHLEKFSTGETSIALDTTIKPDDVLVLDPGMGTRFEWMPSEYLSCTNCPKPEVAGFNYGQIFLCTVYDVFGCPRTELFQVNIDVFIPNVITPNNDGYNDYFRVDGLRPGSRLLIMNRLGEVVFEDTNYNNNWYGTNRKGSQLASGTYWYILSIPEEKEEYKGYVYIKD